MTNTDDDWDRRLLCSDGNCIGVIGADGRCKVCGLPYDGELPLSPDEGDPTEADADDSPTDRQSVLAEPDVKDEPPANFQVPDATWENRTLCGDGACIGVIGPDGRCNECGKPYTE